MKQVRFELRKKCRVLYNVISIRKLLYSDLCSDKRGETDTDVFKSHESSYQKKVMNHVEFINPT